MSAGAAFDFFGVVLGLVVRLAAAVVFLLLFVIVGGLVVFTLVFYSVHDVLFDYL